MTMFNAVTGVQLTETEEREALMGAISDMSKDLNGCRCSYSALMGMSIPELHEQYHYYSRSLTEAIDEDRRRQAANLTTWNQHINNLMTAGARDRATAIRWDMQAMETDDLEYYGFVWDLPYDVVVGLPVMMGAIDARERA